MRHQKPDREPKIQLRDSRLKMAYKKAVLKHFIKFTGEHLE